MRISDWSSDVCSSDLGVGGPGAGETQGLVLRRQALGGAAIGGAHLRHGGGDLRLVERVGDGIVAVGPDILPQHHGDPARRAEQFGTLAEDAAVRSEEHTSEPQSLMRNTYAVLCL